MFLRVGRTARIGQKGEAFLFLRPHEGEYITLLQRHSVSLQQQAVLPLLSSLPLPSSSHAHNATKQVRWKRKQSKRGEVVDEVDEMVSEPKSYAWLQEVEGRIAKDRQLQNTAADAFRATVRAYAGQKGALRKIFHARSLHLGHVASSLGLRQAPSMVGKSSSKQAAKKRKQSLLGHKRQKTDR